MFDRIFDPHFAFSGILDGIDLSLVHFAATLLGALMALYVAKLWSRSMIPMITPECWLAKHVGNVALFVLSLAMLWSLAYSTTKGWHPWPPDLFVLVAIDVFLLATIMLAVKHRRNHTTARP